MANYQKAGYQDALQFDPSSGIVKYGNYEFFADQVGVKPQTQTFDFDTYKKSFTGGTGIASATPMNRMDDAKLRAQFAKDVESGALRMAPAPQGMFADTAARLYGNIQPAYERTETGNVPGGGGLNALANRINNAGVAQFRNVQQTDPNTYSVTSYDIPKDVEFVNKLNAQAANLAANAQQGQVTDSSRPTPGNSRLGKPNYSRAATVLTGAATPLGGAATTLGA